MINRSVLNGLTDQQKITEGLSQNNQCERPSESLVKTVAEDHFKKKTTRKWSFLKNEGKGKEMRAGSKRDIPSVTTAAPSTFCLQGASSQRQFSQTERS